MVLIQTSTGNLDLVMTRITQADENQARGIEAIIYKEKIRVLHAFRNAYCFEQLIGRVSVFALRKLDVERERSYECAEGPRSHSFRNVMTIPCAHELFQFSNGPIPSSMIDCHWYLRDTDALAEEETDNTCVPSTEQSSFPIDMKTLENRFPLWSPAQQGIVRSIIKELASENIPVF
uniref:AlNc14C26G2554 protein n=1 Tax=Albugo laibachii Nc14 TaxID=890382 RepID=F0W6R8_9STRA|nr:AlNc14C26G2554 [Albugo laibachii Nc14]|eukprot:CCA16813.1 AlNc14C26G2554 [Albugo laibachii Nc14]